MHSNAGRNVEQTKMYVCTFEEFILVDVVTLLYKLELNMHWKCCSLYTLATKEWDMWELLLDVQLTLEIE